MTNLKISKAEILDEIKDMLSISKTWRYDHGGYQSEGRNDRYVKQIHLSFYNQQASRHDDLIADVYAYTNHNGYTQQYPSKSLSNKNISGRKKQIMAILLKQNSWTYDTNYYWVLTQDAIQELAGIF